MLALTCQSPASRTALHGACTAVRVLAPGNQIAWLQKFSIHPLEQAGRPPTSTSTPGNLSARADVCEYIHAISLCSEVQEITMGYSAQHRRAVGAASEQAGQRQGTVNTTATPGMHAGQTCLCRRHSLQLILTQISPNAHPARRKSLVILGHVSPQPRSLSQ